jgi:hypothetical protein
MGYEGDYNLHKETEMYRALHPVEKPIEPIFSNTEKCEGDSMQNILKEIEIKKRKKT